MAPKIDQRAKLVLEQFIEGYTYPVVLVSVWDFKPEVSLFNENCCIQQKDTQNQKLH